MAGNIGGTVVGIPLKGSGGGVTYSYFWFWISQDGASLRLKEFEIRYLIRDLIMVDI